MRQGYKFPIGIKLLLLIFFLILGALGTYFWLVTGLIVGDRKAAIFEQSHIRGEQLNLALSTLIDGYGLTIDYYFKSGIHPAMRHFVLEEVFSEREMLGFFSSQRGPQFAQDLEKPQHWFVREIPSAAARMTVQKAFTLFIKDHPKVFEKWDRRVLINLSPYFERLVFGIAKMWHTTTGTLFGALFFEAHQFLSQIPSKAGHTISLVDGEGYYVFHPDHQKVYSRMRTPYLGPIQKMLQEQVGSQTLQLKTPGRPTEHLVSLFRLTKSDTFLVEEVPVDLAYEPIAVLRARSWYFLVAVMLVAIILAIFFAKTITGPIQTLATLTSRIKEGVYSAQMEVHTKDELGALNQSFVDMTQELERRQAAIAREIRNLKMVHESAQSISLQPVAKQLIPMVAERLQELMPLAAVFVGYRNMKGEVITHGVGEVPFDLAHHLRRGEMPGVPSIIDFKDPALVGRVPFLAPLLESPGPMPFSETEDRIALLAVERMVLGCIWVRKRASGGPITPQDEYVLGALATNVGITLRNMELVEETADKARLDNEIRTAQLVQQTLLPKHIPFQKGVRVASHYQAAEACGGDWWGYVQMKDTLVVMMSDVTGHGVGAALVTAALHSAVASIAYFYKKEGQDAFRPSAFLNVLNETLYETTGGTMFLTFFCAALHVPSGRVRYSNAGHDFPWIYRLSLAKGQTPSADYVEALMLKGAALGQSKTSQWEEQEVLLRAGDRLMIFTDGLTDVVNAAGNEWGMGRLRRTFVTHSHEPLEVLKDRIVQSAKAFAGTAKLIDDLTLVLLEYLGSEAGTD